MDGSITVKEEPLFSDTTDLVKMEDIPTLEENSYDVGNKLKLEIEEESGDLTVKLENSVGEPSTVLGRNKAITETNRTFCSNNGSAQFICDYCGFSSDQQKLFVKHVNDHFYSYTCDICNYKTTRSSNLKEHKRIHRDEKPYGCCVCNYRCTHSTDLKQHMRVHSDEKPFSCNVCSYKCARASSLRLHERIHSGEKPYGCTICIYKCTTSSALKKHLRIHSGEKPFRCTICSFKCTTSSSLKRHMGVHGGE